MRHGIAADADPARFRDDALRPLSAIGFRKTHVAARGMRRLGITVERIVTSPLLRAKQTAAIVAELLKVEATRVVESAALTPDAEPLAIIRELAAAPAAASVLLVGHEPHMSALIAKLLAGSDRGMAVQLKKPALCLIDVDPHASRPRGELLFLLQPRHLRLIAAGK